MACLFSGINPTVAPGADLDPTATIAVAVRHSRGAFDLLAKISIVCVL